MSARRLSEDLTSTTPSTLNILSEEMNGMILDKAVTNAEYQQMAFEDLRTLALLPEEKRRIWQSPLDSSKILSAMLEHAPTGRGVRYVSCAILACRKEVDQLLGLASDWLELLLLPFKTSHKDDFLPLSLSLTPTTLSDTPPRHSGFEIDLKHRQGGTCAVMNIPRNEAKFISAHIVRSSIAKAEDSNAGIHPSRAATWNILTQYVDLSDDFIQNLGTTIDSPQNGIVLELALHTAFDEYEWSFDQTEEPGQYTVKWFTRPQFLFKLAGRSQIKFENKYNTPIELPNSKFLAIHRAVAGVLYDSGVGEYVDLLIDTFQSDSPLRPEKFEGQELALRLSLLPLAVHAIGASSLD